MPNMQDHFREEKHKAVAEHTDLLRQAREMQDRIDSGRDRKTLETQQEVDELKRQAAEAKERALEWKRREEGRSIKEGRS